MPVLPHPRTPLALASVPACSKLPDKPGNQLACSDTAFIKNAAPLQGRKQTAGLRFTF